MRKSTSLFILDQIQVDFRVSKTRVYHGREMKLDSYAEPSTTDLTTNPPSSRARSAM